MCKQNESKFWSNCVFHVILNLIPQIPLLAAKAKGPISKIWLWNTSSNCCLLSSETILDLAFFNIIIYDSLVNLEKALSFIRRSSEVLWKSISNKVKYSYFWHSLFRLSSHALLYSSSLTVAYMLLNICFENVCLVSSRM